MGEFRIDTRAPNLSKLIALRSERLCDDSRKVLHCAALIGTSVEFKLLKEALGNISSDKLLNSLKELEKHDFIREIRKFPQRIFKFVNSSFISAIYELIPPSQRAEIHARVARYTELLHGDNLEDHYESLAHHYLNSSEVEKSIHYSFARANQLLRDYRLYDAMFFFQKAYDLINSENRAEKYESTIKAIYKAKWQIFLLLGHYDLALACLKSMKKQYDWNKSMHYEIECMEIEILTDRGEFKKANELLGPFIKKCTHRDDKKTHLKAMTLHAHVKVFTEQLEEAKEICKRAIFLTGDNDNWERGQFLTFLGMAAYYENSNTNAMAYFNKVKKIYSDIGDMPQLGKAYSNIGMVYFKNGNYEKALENYLLSLEILSNVEYPKALAITRMNLAVLYDHTGNYRKALKEYNFVLKQSGALGNSRLLMMVLCNMGEVFIRIGKYKVANRYLKESLMFSRKLGSIFWEMLATFYMGKLENEMGCTQEALDHLLISKELCKKISNRSKEIEIELEIFNTSSKDMHTQELLSLYEEIKSKNLGKSESLNLTVLSLIANSLFKTDKISESIKYYKEGLEHCENSPDREWLLKFNVYIAQALDSLGEKKLAREHIKEGISVLDVIKENVPESSYKHYMKKELILLLESMASKYKMKNFNNITRGTIQ